LLDLPLAARLLCSDLETHLETVRCGWHDDRVVAAEDGVTLTVVEITDPLTSEGGRGEFRAARRVWLGYVPGMEWMHEEAERRFLPITEHVVVTSRRHSYHHGASAETAAIVLELIAAGVAGKLIADFIDHVKNRAREKRQEARLDEADYDFSRWWNGDRGLRQAATWMRPDLAELVGISASRLEIESVEAHQTLVAVAQYRDKKTGHRYRVEVGRDEATFTLLEEPVDEAD
jgi:hypothetical protein